MGLNITSYQAKYLANALTRRLLANDTVKLTGGANLFNFK